MLSTLKDGVCGAFRWAREHKLVVGVGLVGGTALTAYLGYRALLNEASKLQTQLRGEFAQMRQERLGHDCGNAVTTFLHTLRTRLALLADTAAVRAQLRALKSNPQGGDKLALWGELKLLTLTRLFASVYAFALLNLLLRVQLHVLARSSLGSVPIPLPGAAVPDLGASQDVPTPEVRHAFLAASCNHLLGPGLEALVACVRQAVELRMADWELTRLVTAADLRALVRDVRAAVDTFSADPAVPPGVQQFLLLTSDAPLVPAGESVVKSLLDETWDLLESETVRGVADEALGAVFALVTEELLPAAASLPLPKLLPRVETAVSQVLADAEPGEQPFVEAVSGLAGLREFCVAILLAGSE